MEISSSVNELQIGNTLKVRTNITPSNTTNKNITYQTSDKQIAKVFHDGTVKGISAGKVTITATTSNEYLKVWIF